MSKKNQFSKFIQKILSSTYVSPYVTIFIVLYVAIAVLTHAFFMLLFDKLDKSSSGNDVLRYLETFFPDNPPESFGQVYTLTLEKLWGSTYLKMINRFPFIDISFMKGLIMTMVELPKLVLLLAFVACLIAFVYYYLSLLIIPLKTYYVYEYLSRQTTLIILSLILFVAFPLFAFLVYLLFHFIYGMAADRKTRPMSFPAFFYVCFGVFIGQNGYGIQSATDYIVAYLPTAIIIGLLISVAQCIRDLGSVDTEVSDTKIKKNHISDNVLFVRNILAIFIVMLAIWCYMSSHHSTRMQ